MRPDRRPRVASAHALRQAQESRPGLNNNAAAAGRPLNVRQQVILPLLQSLPYAPLAGRCHRYRWRDLRAFSITALLWGRERWVRSNDLNGLSPVGGGKSKTTAARSTRSMQHAVVAWTAGCERHDTLLTYMCWLLLVARRAAPKRARARCGHGAGATTQTGRGSHAGAKTKGLARATPAAPAAREASRTKWRPGGAPATRLARPPPGRGGAAGTRGVWASATARTIPWRKRLGGGGSGSVWGGLPGRGMASSRRGRIRRSFLGGRGAAGD